jgi:hypothetical protein
MNNFILYSSTIFMPFQNSMIKVSGRMGDHIYFCRKGRKNKKQHLIRRAPATVRQTAATQKAAIDFGTASKGSSLIRNALHEYTRLCYDNQLHYHLNKKMGEIVRADVNHPSGQRVITAVNMQSLQGFRFNGEANIQYTPVMENTDTGDINISFPDNFHHKSNTTHITVKAIALSVNIAKNIAQQVESNTVVIKRGEKCAPLAMKINRRNTTLIILEIQSFYEVNGQLHASQNRQYHALDVIAVLPPLEQPVAQKRTYRNQAPHFWLPYAAPARPALIITPVYYNSLPEG